MMKRTYPLYLQFSDLEKLQKKEIGHGTDGTVYRLNKDYLIKIYHTNFRKLKKMQATLSDIDDVKIFDRNSYKPAKHNEIINYYTFDGDAVKISSNEAIFRAMDRQQNVTMTNLPQNVVYINNRVAGCILKRSKGVQIHKLTGLPLKQRKKIFLTLLKQVDELLKNYIYHVDLDNSPFSTSIYINEDGMMEKVGHSHVLVELPSLKPHIIDLEGKSTIYTEQESKKLEAQCLYNLCRLTTEFLCRIDLDDYEDLDEVKDILALTGVLQEFIDPLIDGKASIEELTDFTTSLKRTI